MKQNSLNALIDLATEKRDAAAAALGSLRGEQAAGKAQLDALIAYRIEYGKRLSRAMADGLAMHRLDNDQRFLAALDEAIAQQERIVTGHDNRLAEGKTQWQDRQRRLQSFDALAERRRLSETRLDARREQRDNDEAAGRAARRASG